MRRGPFLLLLALASLFTAGCSSSKACTLIGCGMAFQVDFTGATAVAGDYQVEVVADGVPSSAKFTLPCEAEPTYSAEQLDWRLVLTGCAPGQSGDSLQGIVFPSKGPASLDFVVRRAGEIVGGGSLMPDYRESRPNGPDCEPVCRQAPNAVAELEP